MGGSFVSAGKLRERVAVRRLAFDETAGRWSWETESRLWAKAEEDDRSNLFSRVGIGARGVTFTIRADRRLDLHRSFLWRGKHCFLTAITDAPNARMKVKAAVVKISEILLHERMQQSTCFPGVLTEKYLRHEQREPMSVNLLDLVLVTPKAIRLKPGGLVSAGGAKWEVLTAYELDEWKNEYEIGRRAEL